MRPCSIREDFSAKLDALDHVRSLKMLVKLVLHLSTERDILEHLSHFVNLIGTTLYLELLKEKFFVLPRDRCFVEKTLTKLFWELFEERVTSVEAAEEIDDGVKSLVHLEVWDTFETCTELFVSILSNINRSELLCVHEFLESIITGLLEDHSIAEAIFDKLINFPFEV